MNQIKVLQSILKKPMKDESYLNKIKSQDPYCEFLGRKNQRIFYSKKYIEIVSTSFDNTKLTIDFKFLDLNFDTNLCTIVSYVCGVVTT